MNAVRYPLTSLPIIALALGSATAAARSEADSKEAAPYYQSGPWTVEEPRGARFCTLTLSGLEEGELRLSKAEAEPAYFDYQPKERLGYGASPRGVVWKFDDHTIAGWLLVGSYYQIYDKDWESRSDSALAEQHLRSAYTLTIAQNDETVVEIDLSGSAKAFDELVKCAAQWPGATVPVTPPPAPPPPPSRQPRTTLSEPDPLAQQAVPLAPDRWITAEDIPASFLAVEQTRRVQIALRIAPTGGIEHCEVINTGGSSAIEDLTCALITERARFKPATDANGSPVRALYRTTVTWDSPGPLKEAPEE